jgi:peptide deformylase
MTYLVPKKHKSLHQKSELVNAKDILSPKIQNIISKMQEEMDKHSDGVAIAAPQIGESVAIFCIAKNAYSKTAKDPQLVFINPKIIKTSKEKDYMMEGCLSVRWLYGEVYRHKQVMLESYDETGKKILRGASGLIAQIFQHELDHLNGILFDSKAINIENFPPEKVKEMEEKNKRKLEAKTSVNVK